MNKNRLTLELETYHEHLPELTQQAGKYVLVKGEALVDTFDSYEDALKRGYAQFGLEPFLVKQIEQSEQALFFTRHLQPDAMECLV